MRVRALFLCVAVLLPVAALAQRGVEPRRPALPQPSSTAASVASRQLRDIQALMRQDRHEDALRQLDALEANRPAGVPADEIASLRGACLRRLGRMEEAKALYRERADGAAKRGEDPMGWLVELERIEREMHNPLGAFHVCLEIHRTGRSPGRWVLEEMESLIQADSLGGQVLEELRSEISRRPESGDLRDLLVGALLFLGQPEAALQEATALDKARDARGRTLLQHARLLDQKGYEEEAVAAADAAVAAGLDGDELQEALLLRAHALRRAGRFAEAGDAYARSAAVRPRGPLAVLALTTRADLLARNLNDVPSAAKAYEDLVSSLEGSPVKERGRLLAQALVSLADCRLRMGDYERAAETLRQVERSAVDAAEREEAVFQQAEILFYSGQVDTARAAYDALVREFAGGKRVNDALERILLLTRNAESGALPLAGLGQIALQRRLGAPSRALEICIEASAACGDCPAAEDFLREESLLLLQIGRVEEAKSRGDSLAARFPESAAAPAVLRAIADGMRMREGPTPEVQRRYEDLLIRYPKSHDAMEVRAMLEKMRRESRG